jgi:ABC-2 type transport system ATP-binding protein
VDPVSRRDFWAILYTLVQDGLTVFVTTAYLDEAERANRVGFMHKGKMIQCDTPAALKHGLQEETYRIKSADNRKTRQILISQPGVLAVQPTGTDLHLFLEPEQTQIEKLRGLTEFDFYRILPSLEDVFIALMYQQEGARAA